MRPVNLIPPEARRGESAPARAGAGAYLVVGVLAVLLVAVAATVLLGKKVDEVKAEVATLEIEAAAKASEAQQLAAYTEFQSIRDTRVATIDSLARSRFDWERVMRELAIVLPNSVWLTSLTGTVSPEVSLDGADGGTYRDEIPGPALQIIGCARSQPDISRMINAIGDIDGVTRVTAVNGTRSDPPASGTQSGSESSDTCGKPTAPEFELIAAFDEVAVAPGAPADPAAAPDTAQVSDPAAADGGVAATEEQSAQGAEEVEGAQRQTEQAAAIPSGGQG